MRVTQVEVQTNSGERRVYWLDDDPYNDCGLTEGQQVLLGEEIARTGLDSRSVITRKMTSVSDELKPWLIANLKARMGTILELSSAQVRGIKHEQ